MSTVLADALERLLAAPGPVAASQFTPAQRGQLDRFAQQVGALRRSAGGRGTVYQVTQPALALLHLRTLRPVPAGAIDSSLPVRANNIARLRDSKGRAHGHGAAYLLLKAIGTDVAWRRGDGAMLDLSAQTALAGAAVLALGSAGGAGSPGDPGWHSGGPLWLVENQALFDRLDWLPPHAHGAVAYYGGQLSNLLLDWLAGQARATEIVFFPDYDGVGLANYARLLARSRAPVVFWLMPDWLARLRQYGSNSVWLKTYPMFQAALAQLAAAPLAPELLALTQAMASHGLALEHEAVWLAAPAPGP